jgi:hypothetical protein
VTDVVVGRLRIACRAGPGRRSDALALRRRLERVSRTELPRALERRARGWRDATVGPVAVAFDFDPLAYDDVTLAVLWADRIGRAVERAARSVGTTVQVGAHAGSTATPPTPPAALTTRADWTAALARALSGETAALAEVAAALEAPAERAAVLAALGPGQAGVLAARFEALAARIEAGLAGDPAASEPVASPGPERAEPAVAEGERFGTSSEAREGRRPVSSRELRAAAARLREAGVEPRAGAPRDRTEEPARERAPRPLVLATGCAGVVLPYPWLPRLLDDAVEARPDVDPVAVRRLALAAVVAEPGAEDDPLVRLLAGDDPTEPPGALLPYPETAAAAAEELLRRFAGSLPGFERSTPGYLRRELIVRPGAVELDREPIRVVLAPAPLDVMLRMLPYPLGMFRLPWTDPLTIRLEGG